MHLIKECLEEKIEIVLKRFNCIPQMMNYPCCYFNSCCWVLYYYWALEPDYVFFFFKLCFIQTTLRYAVDPVGLKSQLA